MIALTLAGSPYQRGLQQAAVDPALRQAALSWMTLRHGRVEERLADPATLGFARDLHAHALTAAPGAMEELRGIAEGFGIAPFDLFCGWHAAVLGEAHAARDGCTAIAIGSPAGAHVAKNRDVPGDTQRIQAVFRMSDPSWRGGGVLGVSSLGSSPCASSGINEAGLCVADTQVPTRDHGVGLIRYVVMQMLLQDCRTVPEALVLLRGTRHAGGGALVLADARGAVAVIELGHRRIHIEQARNATLARTNHFTGRDTAADNFDAADTPAGTDSRARLAAVARLLASRNGHPLAGEVVALLSSHDAVHPLCRHGYGVDQPKTISLALFDVAGRSLTITGGTPCSSPSVTYKLEMTFQPEFAP